MAKGRQRGCKDKRPRVPKRGSESSRLLARRLQSSGRPLTTVEISIARSTYELELFFAEQEARIKRTTDRQVARVVQARRQQQKDNETATRAEAVTSFHVEVRGSCGSDVHVGQS